jgi:hypothetical protein
MSQKSDKNKDRGTGQNKAKKLTIRKDALKDLDPKKDAWAIRGNKLAGNDNITLVVDKGRR